MASLQHPLDKDRAPPLSQPFYIIAMSPTTQNLGNVPSFTRSLHPPLCVWHFHRAQLTTPANVSGHAILTMRPQTLLASPSPNGAHGLDPGLILLNWSPYPAPKTMFLPDFVVSLCQSFTALHLGSFLLSSREEGASPYTIEESTREPGACR